MEEKRMKLVCQNKECGKELGAPWERRLLNTWDQDKMSGKAWEMTSRAIEEIENHPCKYCQEKVKVVPGTYTDTSKKPLSGKEWTGLGSALKREQRKLKKERKELVKRCEEQYKILKKQARG